MSCQQPFAELMVIQWMDSLMLTTQKVMIKKAVLDINRCNGTKGRVKKTEKAVRSGSCDKT